MPKDPPVNTGACPGAPIGAWSAGIGDAGQASPLGGGRSWPPVRRPVQLRARPGDADRGVRPGRGQHRGAEHAGRRRPRRPPTSSRAIGVPGFLDDLRASLKTGTFRPLPVRERKIPKPGGSGKLRKSGYSDRGRSGGPGGVEAGAGTDLRGRLPAGLLRVPTEPAGPRRDRRDPPVRHPGLPVGAGR